MKKVVLIILPLALLACSTQKDTPIPDAGTAVSGEYQLLRRASFSNNDPVYDVKLPKTTGAVTETGKLVITRSSPTAIYLAVVLQVQQVSGVSSATTTFGKMDVKETSSGYEFSQYDASQPRSGSGTASGGTIAIEFSDTYLTTTTRYIIEAKR